MEGLSGTKRDSREAGGFTNRISPGSQVVEHIHRFIKSDRFHLSSEARHQNLKERLARYSGCSEDYLQLCAGFDRAVDSIARAFCTPGDNIIICGPVDNDMGSRLARFGLKTAVHQSQTPFNTDVDGILENITEKTRLIYLEQPNSITGTVYSRFEIETLLNRSRNIFLILNESFYEYFGADAAGLTAGYDNLIILRSIKPAFESNHQTLFYIMAGNRVMSRLERYSQDDSPASMRSMSVTKILENMGEEYFRSTDAGDSMIYLSVKLRTLGITCRLTPADFILIRSVNPDEVVAALQNAGLRARSLSHLPQLENYLQLIVDDEASAHLTVEVLENMPGQFFGERRTVRSRLTLRRPAEMEKETLELNKDNFDTRNG